MMKRLLLSLLFFLGHLGIHQVMAQCDPTTKPAPGLLVVTSPSTGCIPFTVNFKLTCSNVRRGDTTQFRFYSGTGDSIILPTWTAGQTFYDFSYTYTKSNCNNRTPLSNPAMTVSLIAFNKHCPTPSRQEVINKSIVVYNPPILRIETADLNVCAGVNSAFTNQTKPNYCGSNFTHYTWNWGDGSPEETYNDVVHVYWTGQSAISDTLKSQQERSHTYLNGGNYTLTLKAKEEGGGGNCSNNEYIKTFNVRVTGPPNAAFTLPTNDCINSGNLVWSITNQSTAGINGTITSHQWSVTPAATFSSTTASSPTLTFNAPGTYTVRLTVANSCTTSTLERIVQIRSRATGTISSAPEVCQGSPITFTSTIQENNSTVTAYNWNFGADATPQTSTSFNPGAVTYSTSGPKTITLNLTNACGVSSSITRAITVNPFTKPIISPSSLSFCTGATSGNVLSFSNVGALSGYTIKWFRDGNEISGSIGTSLTVSQSGSYTAQSSSGKGCISNSDPVNVTVRPLPEVNLTTPQGIEACQNDNITISVTSTTGATYQWFDGTTLISGATSSTYIIPSNIVRTFNLSARVILSGCTATSVTQGIRIKAKPTVSLSAAPNVSTICDGQTLTLSSTVTPNTGGYQFQWLRNNTPISGATSSTLAVTMPGDYSLSAALEGCTTISASRTVNVTSLATVTISSNNSTICQGSNATLNSIVTGGSGTVSYLWFRDNVQQTALTSGTINVNTAGNYTLRVISNACTSQVSNSVQVTVITKPATPSIVVSPGLTICAGEQTTLTASTSTPGAATFEWFRDGTSLGNSNPLVVTTGGSYRVSVSIAGCLSDLSTASLVSVTPLPDASITASGATTLCQPSAVTLSTPARTGAQYQWFRDGLPVSGATSNSLSANQSGGYTVRVVSSGCTSQTATPTQVIINPLPDINVTIGGAATVCSPQTVTLNAVQLPGYQYQWLLNNNPIASATSSSHIISGTTSNGSYSCRIIFNGCTATSTPQSVTINPQPTVSISAAGSSTICSGKSIVLNSSVSPTTAISYQWLRGGVEILGATQASFTATQAGVYSLRVTINSTSCAQVSSNSITVVVNPLPTISITSLPIDGNICSGSNFTLTASNTTYSSYSWERNAVPISGANQITYSGGLNGTYRLRVVDANGCEAISNEVVISIIGLPSVTITPSGTTEICNGLSTTLTANLLANHTYRWYKNNVLLPGFTNNTLSANEQGAFFAEAVSQSGCVGKSNTVNVVVNPVPVFTVNSVAPEICQGRSTVLTVSSSQAGLTYSWAPATGLSTTAGASVTASPGTTTTYTITATDSKGCKSTNTVTVAVIPNPDFTLTPNATVCNGDPTNINASLLSSNGSVTYFWSPSTGLNSTNSASVIASPTTTTIYSLTVTDSKGCAKTSSVTVSVNNRPNVNLSSSLNTICIGTTITLTATGANSYTFTNNTGTPTTSTGANSITASPSVTTRFIVRGVSSLTNCDDTASVLITVNQKPVINAGPSREVCKGSSSVNLTSFATIPPATTSSWTVSTGLTSTGLFDPVAAPIGVTICTLRVTNTITGCFETDTISVRVLPLPIINLGSSPTFCYSPIKVNLSATPAGGTWSGSPSVTSAGEFTPNLATKGINNLTYTFTDSKGCVNSASLAVNVIDPPTVDAGSHLVVCRNISPISLTTRGIPTGGTWSGTGVSGNTFNPMVSSVGRHILTYTFGNATCLQSDTFSIRVLQKPSAAFTSLNSICLSDSLTLNNTSVSNNNGGLNFQWSYGFSGGTSSQLSPKVKFPNSGSFNVRLVAIDAFGCSDTSTRSITVNPLPTVSISSSSTLNTICRGQSTTLTAVGGLTYQWVSQPGLSSTTGASVSVNPTVNTTYTVTATDINGCQNTASITITVADLPNPQIIFSKLSRTICSGDEITFTASGGSGYVWTGPNLSGTNTASVTAKPTATSNYTLRVHAANNCFKDTSFTITVNQLPTVSAGASQSVCFNAASLSLAGSPTGGTWSGAGVSPIGIFNPSVVAEGSLQVLRYTYTDPITQCVNSDTLGIRVLPLPIINIGAQPNLCNTPTPVNLSATPTGGLWFGSTALTSTGVFTPSAVGVGTHKVFYAVTSANGCRDTASIDLIIVDPAIVDAGTHKRNCINDREFDLSTFNASPSGGTFTGVGVAGNKFNPKLAGVGLHLLTYAFGTGSCRVTDTVSVRVLPKPTAQFNIPIEVCLRDSVSLISSSAPGLGSLSYSWNTGSTGGNNTSTSEAFRFKYSTAGTYTISLIVTNTGGCSDTLRRVIVVNPEPTNTITSTPAAICEGEASQLNVTTVGNGPFTYLWTPSLGLDRTNTAQVSANPTITTNYKVRVTDAKGCFKIDSISLLIRQKPQISFVADTVCVGNFTSFTASAVPAGSATINPNYVWTFGAALTDLTQTTTANPKVVYADSGRYTAMVRVTDNFGCSQTFQKQVYVRGLPSVNFNGNRRLCINSPEFNIPQGTPAGGRFYGTGIALSDSITGIFNPSLAGVGKHVITYVFNNRFGCKSSDTQSIEVRPKPIIDANGAIPGNSPYVFCTSNSLDTLRGRPFGGRWIGSGVVGDSLFNPAIYSQNPGVLRYIYTDPITFCTDTGTANVSLTLPEQVEVLNSFLTCLNKDSVTLTNKVTRFNGGTWSGKGVVNNIFYPRLAGVGKHLLIYSRGFKTCRTLDTLTMDVAPLPRPSFNLADVCLNFTSTFVNTSTSSLSLALNYQWNFGDPGTLNDTSSALNPTYRYSNPGLYTVRLRVIDFNGCDSTILKLHEVRPKPKAGFFVSDVCQSTAANFVDTSKPAGTNISARLWDLGDGTTRTTATFTHRFPKGDTTYTVRLIATDGNGCSDTTFRSVRINPMPISAFNIAPVCKGSAWFFRAGRSKSFGNLNKIVSYRYKALTVSGFDRITKDSVLVTASFPNPGNYPIRLIVTDTNGCRDSSEVNAIVNDAPEARISTTQIVEGIAGTCVGKRSIFRSTTLPYSGSSIVRMRWNFGDQGTQSDTLNVNANLNDTVGYSYTTPGIYRINLIAYDNNGCFDTASLTYEVFPLPIVKISTQRACLNEDALFIDSSFSNRTTIASRLWSFGDGVGVATSINPVYRYADSGAYTVVLKVVDRFGCEQIGTNTIKITRPPIADFTVSDVCNGQESKFINLSQGVGIGLKSFLWRIKRGASPDTTIQTSTLDTFRFKFHTFGSYQVTLIALDNNNCSQTITKTAIVNPAPNVNFTLLNHCFNESVTFVDLSTPLQGATLTSWLWTLGDGSTNTNSNFSYRYAAPGKYQVTLTINDSKGCFSIKKDSITVYHLPEPVFTANRACVDSFVVFNADLSRSNSGAITQYRWDFDDGSPVINTAVSNTFKRYTTSGTYQVKLTTITNFGCVNDTVIPVTITPLPLADFQATEVCNGTPVQFTALPTIQTGGRGIEKYKWFFGGQGTGFDTLGPNPQFIYQNFGVYRVRVLITDSNGCARFSVFKDIKVNPAPIARFTVNPVCSLETSIFRNQSRGISPGNGLQPRNIVRYLWNFGTGNPADTSSLTEPAFKYALGGQFKVVLTAWDNFGCRSADSTFAIVYNKPNPDFSALDACLGVPTIFSDLTDTSAGLITNWQWRFDDGNASSTLNNPIHQFSRPDTFRVRLITTNRLGCRDTIIKPVVVNPLPVANFRADTVCSGSLTTLTDLSRGIATNTNGAVVKWKWDFGIPGDADTSNQQNPNFKFDTAGQFSVSLTVQDINGCQRTIIKPVIVNPAPRAGFKVDPVCFTYPNIFTDLSVPRVSVGGVPNPRIVSWFFDFGDGSNDSLFSPPTNRGFSISHKYDTSGKFRVVLTVFDDRGCFNTKIDTAIVYPLPKVKFFHDSVFCVNRPENFFNQTSGGLTYQWFFGDGTKSDSINPVKIYQDTGFFDIKLIATNELGCQDSAFSKVEVILPPTVDFTKDRDTGCGPYAVTFTNLSKGKYLNFRWDFGNGITSEKLNPDPVVFFPSRYQDTTYYIKLFVLNRCDTVVKLDSVTVFPSPWAQFSTTVSSGCTPLTVGIRNHSVGNPNSFKWILEDGTETTAFNPAGTRLLTTTGLNISKYNFTLIAYNKCGTDTLTKTITVYPDTVAAGFTASNTRGCSPLKVLFTNTAKAYRVVSYDFGDGTRITDSSNTINHTYSNAGFYTVKQFVSNFCANDTLVQTSLIEVLPKPSLSFTTLGDSTCLGFPFTFINLSNPATYNRIIYKFGDGNTATPSSQATNYKYFNPGIYRVWLIGINSLGCSDSVSRIVKVYPKPKASFATSLDSVCINTPVSFTDSSIGALYFAWSFADGQSSNINNPIHSFKRSGLYNVRLVIQNLGGCTDTTYKTIKVYKEVKSIFTLSKKFDCRYPSILGLTNSSENSIKSQWFINNKPVSADSSISTELVFDSAGSFKITLLSTSSDGCKDSATQTYVVDELPIINFNYRTFKGCQPLVVAFNNRSQNAQTYKWYFGDGDSSTLPNPTHTYLRSGVYKVVLIGTRAGVCTEILRHEDSVVVLPKPFANFEWEQLPKTGQVRFTNRSIGAIKYWWLFENRNKTTTENPLYSFGTGGPQNILMIAENEDGCTDTVRRIINLEVFKGLYIPNAFRINIDDPELKFFRLKGAGLAEIDFKLYDKWNNLIWTTKTLENGATNEVWDGYYMGDQVPTGTYYWSCEAKFIDGTKWEGQTYENELPQKTGTLTVLK